MLCCHAKSSSSVCRVLWVWPAGRRRGRRLPPGQRHVEVLFDRIQRAPPRLLPTNNHPPSLTPTPPSYRCHSSALYALRRTRRTQESYEKTHTHTCTETPLPNATNPKYFTEACVSSPLARPVCGSLRSGCDVMNHPFPEPAAGGERDGVRTAKSQTLPTSTFWFLLTHFYG